MRTNNSTAAYLSEMPQTRPVSGVDPLALLRGSSYWLFVLLSVAVFVAGILAYFDFLPAERTAPAALPRQQSVPGPRPHPEITVPPAAHTINPAQAPKQQIRDLQLLLSRLDYRPGQIDGIWGSNTEQALLEFLGDQQLPAETDLNRVMELLSDSVPALTTLPAGYHRMQIRLISDPATSAKQPAMQPEIKRCRPGFRPVDGHCMPLLIPDKGFLNAQGTDWECIPGYRKYKGQCAPLPLPSNAFINYSGNGWECMRGYIQVGAECMAEHLVRQPVKTALAE